MFGRGGEEAEALAAAGIDFEVVPGVTAGVAAPAYAGIPVTHRDDASAVAFVTGHEDPAKDDSAIDWEALARFPGTLVLYMGVKTLPEIAERLIAAGRDRGRARRGDRARDAARPAGGRGDRWARSPRPPRREGIKPPAVTVIGPVAARREAIDWLERRPLHGVRVVVTRARAQASELSPPPRRRSAPSRSSCRRSGSSPGSTRDEVRRAVEALHTYALVCLTSANGVHLLFEAMAAQGRDARALANATVAAIGPGTAAALAEHGIAADVVPERFVAESLVEALADVPVEGKPVLIARAAEARDVLPDALRERGAEVDVVALYETVAETPPPEAIEAAQSADFITFTSSSTVRNLVDAARRRPAATAQGDLDRPGHQRGRPRGGPRGPRRGRAPRHRRPGRSAARRSCRRYPRVIGFGRG